MTTFRLLFLYGYDYVLSLEVQFFNDLLVCRRLLFLQISQKLPAAGNHLEKTATGMVILRILLQMRRKLVDLPRNDGDMNSRGPRVRFVLLEFSRHAGFYSLCEHGFII